MFNHQNKYPGLDEAVFIVCMVTFIVLLILSSYFFGGSATIGGILIIIAVSMGLILIWDFFRYGLPWIFWAYYTVSLYIFHKVKDKWFQKKSM